MKKMFSAIFCILLLAAFPSMAGRLSDNTLRIDYIFSGTDTEAEISVASLGTYSGWAGRRVNMQSVPLKGNGRISMYAASDGELLYAESFSTLFQEWQATEEATRVRRSFENVYLLPMPSEKVDVTVELFDFHGGVAAVLTHPVDPSDILIRPLGQHPCTSVYVHQGGSPEDCIDVVIVPEGYTEDEMELFLDNARSAVSSIFGHEPFGTMKDKFSFLAAMLPSRDSGVSVPGDGIWRETACGAHFDTFYTDRYLTTLNVRHLHDLLSGLPYEHIIILANTDTYGGGGIYNSYTLTTARHPLFAPVVVHEFGHSFAGLADEYYYDDQFVEYYYPDTEPWEQNITTKADFASKWQDMMKEKGVGLHEGGGYQSKGVWRGSRDCRMKTNTADGFCPVCRRAIERMILFYTEAR